MKHLAITLVCLLFLSCNTSKKELPSKLDSFFEKNSSAQTFFIQGDSLNSFLTKNGVVIEISKDEIQNTNNGDLRLEVTEIFDKSGMIFHRVSTNTIDGKLLESKGMFNFRIYSDETAVKLKEGGKIRVKLPRKDNLKNYGLYDGVLHDRYIEWTNSKINRIDTFTYKTEKEISFDYGGIGAESITYYLTGTDTIYRERQLIFPEDYPDEITLDTTLIPSDIRNSVYYMFEPLALDWINIDRLIESDSSVSLLVKSDTSLYQKHFLVFKDRNSVLLSLGEPNPVFERIPPGEELELISVANKEDQLLYSVNSLTLEAPLELEVNFIETTEAELKTIIESVNEKGN